MQQHLPQTPTMPFPVKHENLQDSYYQQQVSQQPTMEPISPQPLAISAPPSIQIPAPRSPPVGKCDVTPQNMSENRITIFDICLRFDYKYIECIQ